MSNRLRILTKVLPKRSRIMGFLRPGRVLLLLLLLFASYGAVAWLALPFSAQLRSLLYFREVQFSGTNHLSPESLQSAVPHQLTNFTWYFRPERVARDLRMHPHVKEVKVRPCRPYSFSCFSVEIAERPGELIAKVAGKNWYIAGDGSFIEPYEGDLRFRFLPLVEGQLLESLAPEVARGRLRNIVQLVDQLSRKLELRIDSVSPLRSGEVRVRFRGHQFEAVFDEDSTQYPEKVKRLEAILSELDQRVSEVESVDLAFRRVGVVRFRQDQE